MNSRRASVVLAAFGMLAATEQLLAMRWGLLGEGAGALMAGGLVLVAWRFFAREMEHIYVAALVAIAASFLGLSLGIVGSAAPFTPAVWAISFLAALPCVVPMLWIALRAAKCQLCAVSLRGLLSFSCPRCGLVACENCWEFERDRCHLCATNQAPLFALDASWWEKRFGPRVLGGRCVLCLRAPDWEVAHWACPSCGHPQCRLCWDENNGQCSRCAWTIPAIDTHATGGHARTGQGDPLRRDFSQEQEESHAQIPNAFRHSSRGKEIQRRH